MQCGASGHNVRNLGQARNLKPSHCRNRRYRHTWHSHQARDGSSPSSLSSFACRCLHVKSVGLRFRSNDPDMRAEVAWGSVLSACGSEGGCTHTDKAKTTTWRTNRQRFLQPLRGLGGSELFGVFIGTSPFPAMIPGLQYKTRLADEERCSGVSTPPSHFSFSLAKRHSLIGLVDELTSPENGASHPHPTANTGGNLASTACHRSP